MIMKLITSPRFFFRTSISNLFFFVELTEPFEKNRKGD